MYFIITRIMNYFIIKNIIQKLSVISRFNIIKSVVISKKNYSTKPIGKHKKFYKIGLKKYGATCYYSE